MSLRRGDFALVYFPHSDLRTVKLRPVLVVQAEELNTGLPQVIVAMVTIRGDINCSVDLRSTTAVGDRRYNRMRKHLCPSV
jgi:mRNA-degrading endonuclease toxin of MazEF toxin-antitoxin module